MPELIVSPSRRVSVVELLQQAIAWDKSLKFNPRERAKSVAAANNLVLEGEALAKAGDIEAAATKFTEAKNLDPNLDFGPETHAKKLLVENYISEGRSLVNSGDVDGAVQAY
ncbi:MAG: hypothetical protein AAFW95_00595 [Cyanobacteria bacterium J06638_6]